jgi:hypothetical protein
VRREGSEGNRNVNGYNKFLTKQQTIYKDEELMKRGRSGKKLVLREIRLQGYSRANEKSIHYGMRTTNLKLLVPVPAYFMNLALGLL